MVALIIPTFIALTGCVENQDNVIEEHLQTIQNLNTQITDLNSRIDELKAEMSDLYTEAQVQARLAPLNAQIQSLTTAIANIAAGQTGDVQAHLTWITNELRDLRETIEDLQAQLNTPTPQTQVKVPDNLAVNDLVASWDSVANATSYLLAVYNKGTKLTLTVATNAVSFDLSILNLANGEFTVSVQAIGRGLYDGTIWLNSNFSTPVDFDIFTEAYVISEVDRLLALSNFATMTLTQAQAVVNDVNNVKVIFNGLLPSQQLLVTNWNEIALSDVRTLAQNRADALILAAEAVNTEVERILAITSAAIAAMDRTQVEDLLSDIEGLILDFNALAADLQVLVYSWDLEALNSTEALADTRLDEIVDEENLALALAAFTIPNITGSSVVLPTTGLHGATIVYVSATPVGVINLTTGAVVRDFTNVTVTITFTMTVGTAEVTDTIDVIVDARPYIALSTPAQIQALGAGDTSLVRVRGIVIYRNAFATPDVFLQTADGRGHFVWRAESFSEYFVVGNELELIVNARGPLNGGLKTLDGESIEQVRLLSTGQPLPAFNDITNQLLTYSNAELAVFQMSRVEVRGLTITALPTIPETAAFNITAAIGHRTVTLRVENTNYRAALNDLLRTLSVGDVLNIKAPAGWFNGIQFMLTRADYIEIEESESEILAVALALFSMPNISSDTVILPTTGAHGTTVEFLSATPAGIINLETGAVVQGALAVTVTLSFVMTLGSSSANSTIELVVEAVAVPRPLNIMISQIYAGGGNVNAPFNQKFVELFNPLDVAVDISGWTLRYVAPAASNFPVPGNANFLVFPAGTIVPARSFFLIGIHSGANGAALPIALDFEDTRPSRVNPGANAGILILMDDDEPFVNAEASNVVDLVGWFAVPETPVNLFAGQPFQRPSGNITSIIRDNLVNTFNNANDFIISPTPYPRNSTTTA